MTNSRAETSKRRIPPGRVGKKHARKTTEAFTAAQWELIRDSFANLLELVEGDAERAQTLGELIADAAVGLRDRREIDKELKKLAGKGAAEGIKGSRELGIKRT